MTWRQRLANYERQTGRIGPTARQSRRLIKKQRRFSLPLFAGEPGRGQQPIPIAAQ